MSISYAYADKFAIIGFGSDGEFENYNDHTSEEYTDPTCSKQLLLSYDAQEHRNSEYRFHIVEKLILDPLIYATSSYEGLLCSVIGLSKDFAPESTQKSLGGNYSMYAGSFTNDKVDCNRTKTEHGYTASTDVASLARAIFAHGMAVCNTFSSDVTTPAKYSSAFALHIYYGQSMFWNAYDWEASQHGEVEATKPVEFSIPAYLPTASYFSFVDPAMVAAEFRYRSKGTTEYTAISIPTVSVSGEKVRATLQGNEIPETGLEYQFALTAETEDGAGYTTATDWIEIYPGYNLFVSTLPASGGFVNRYAESVFTAQVQDGGFCNKFRYRVKGTTEYTEIGVTGTSVTIPKDTFISGELEYQFDGTDMYGRTYTSEWVAFTTADATPTATPKVPRNEIVYSDKGVTFSWEHRTEYGTPQTKAIIETSSDDGATWATLTTVEGSETTVTVQGIASGTFYWRVQTYNLDSVASAWSDAAQFIAIRQPSTPLMNVIDSSARPIISWQTSEQTAFEFMLDDNTYHEFGGGSENMRWQSSDYISSGEHIARVRVQNSYGLWSDWGSITFTVSEYGSGGISLDVNAQINAKLSWATSTEYDFYIVYRNGKPIAKVPEKEYTDYFAIGQTTYQVKGGYNSSGGYGISTEISVNIAPKAEVVIDTETLDVAELQMTDEADRRVTVTNTIRNSSYELSGKEKPSIETSILKTKTVAFTAAFENAEDGKKLTDMLGKTVCLKTRRGRMAIGVLTALPVYDEEFYSVYTISVTDSDFSEVIDIDTGLPI